MADEQKSQIVVKDVSVNPHTGHITILVETQTQRGNSTWTGPARGYGVDAAMFQSAHGGDVEQLKRWVAGQHQAYTGVHGELVNSLIQLKGQVIG